MQLQYQRIWVLVVHLKKGIRFFFWLSTVTVLIVNKNLMNGLKSAAESRLRCSFPPELFVASDFYCEARGSCRRLCYSLSLQQRGLLLNTEQLVCPQQCNRIWERPEGYYHHHSVWPTKSAKAPSPTAASAKQLHRVHSKLLKGLRFVLIQFMFKAAVL